jgi:hypothetical protein
MARRKSRPSTGIRPVEVISTAVIVLAIAVTAFVLGQRFTGSQAAQLAERVADRVQVPVPARLVAPRTMRTIYLNREGARLTGGPDDSQVNQSSIVAHAGLTHADVPAFASTPARWRAIVKCIASKFAPFDVRVVDQRPVGEDYVMAMMGGTVGVLGDYSKKHHTHALGLSPYNGKAIEDAVVLIFTRAARENTRKVCETAGMEIGHAYGLDHARHCRDLMTYMKPCGTKRFMDEALACGEGKDRACGNGQPTQNSHGYLLELLGPSPLAASK